MLFLSESGCKGRAFFNTRKTFSSFFWKKIFRKFRTADLQHLKLKFRTEDNFHTNYNNTLLFIARDINSQAIRLTPIRPYVLPQQDHTSYQGKTYGLSKKTQMQGQWQNICHRIPNEKQEVSTLWQECKQIRLISWGLYIFSFLTLKERFFL